MFIEDYLKSDELKAYVIQEDYPFDIREAAKIVYESDKSIIEKHQAYKELIKLNQELQEDDSIEKELICLINYENQALKELNKHTISYNKDNEIIYIDYNDEIKNDFRDVIINNLLDYKENDILKVSIPNKNIDYIIVANDNSPHKGIPYYIINNKDRIIKIGYISLLSVVNKINSKDYTKQQKEELKLIISRGN